MLYRGSLARAEYEVALSHIQTVRRWLSNKPYILNIQVLILLWAGRYAEAEKACVNLVTRKDNNPHEMSVGLSNLGYALIEQERYAEALPIIESSIKIAPEYGAVYGALVHLYLRQEIEVERALELVGMALEYTPKPKSNLFLQNYQWAMLKAKEAQAAALTGRTTRANVSIDDALAHADLAFVTGAAALNFDAGIVRMIQGDTIAARKHFEHAIHFDSDGAAGQGAKRSLRDLDNLV